MTHWTPPFVEARLAEAAAILTRLPAGQVPAGLGPLPDTLIAGRQEMPRKSVSIVPPSPTSIKRMEEALRWTQDLDPQDYEIVWLRACGLPWKAICRAVGLQRTAAYTHWTCALSRIALELNGRQLERDASQRLVIERARAAKS